MQATVDEVAALQALVDEGKVALAERRLAAACRCFLGARQGLQALRRGDAQTQPLIDVLAEVVRQSCHDARDVLTMGMPAAQPALDVTTRAKLLADVGAADDGYDLIERHYTDSLCQASDERYNRLLSVVTLREVSKGEDIGTESDVTFHASLRALLLHARSICDETDLMWEGIFSGRFRERFHEALYTRVFEKEKRLLELFERHRGIQAAVQAVTSTKATSEESCVPRSRIEPILAEISAMHRLVVTSAVGCKVATTQATEALTMSRSLLGDYLVLEQHFLESNLDQALRNCEMIRGDVCPSLVDDVVFILNTSLQRAFGTRDADVACAAVHAAAALLQTAIAPPLASAIANACARGAGERFDGREWEELRRNVRDLSHSGTPSTVVSEHRSGPGTPGGVDPSPLRLDALNSLLADAAAEEVDGEDIGGVVRLRLPFPCTVSTAFALEQNIHALAKELTLLSERIFGRSTSGVHERVAAAVCELAENTAAFRASGNDGAEAIARGVLRNIRSSMQVLQRAEFANESSPQYYATLGPGKHERPVHEELQNLTSPLVVRLARSLEELWESVVSLLAEPLQRAVAARVAGRIADWIYSIVSKCLISQDSGFALERDVRELMELFQVLCGATQREKFVSVARYAFLMALDKATDIGDFRDELRQWDLDDEAAKELLQQRADTAIR